MFIVNEHIKIMNIRNMYPNNDIIYEATSKLEQLINIPIEVTNREHDYDVLLTIKGQQFIVEVKSAIRTSNQGLILSQLIFVPTRYSTTTCTAF